MLNLQAFVKSISCFMLKRWMHPDFWDQQKKINKHHDTFPEDPLHDTFSTHVSHTLRPHLVKFVCWAFVHPKHRDRNTERAQIQSRCMMMQWAHKAKQPIAEKGAGDKRWKTVGRMRRLLTWDGRRNSENGKESKRERVWEWIKRDAERARAARNIHEGGMTWTGRKDKALIRDRCFPQKNPCFKVIEGVI